LRTSALLKMSVEEEKPSTKDKLIDVIMAAREKLAVSVVSPLVVPMPGRIRKLRDDEGNHLDY
jgi:hypothetical protein